MTWCWRGRRGGAPRSPVVVGGGGGGAEGRGKGALRGPGGGNGGEGTGEGGGPGVDHEPVAVRRRGLAHRPEPFRMAVGITEAAGGVVGVLEVAAGGPRAPQR